MSLTVGEFQRLAGVTVYRDSEPNTPFETRVARAFVPQRADKPMTPFRGGDYLLDTASGRQVLRRHAVERFAAASGYAPDWAIGAGAEAALADNVCFTADPS